MRPFLLTILMTASSIGCSSVDVASKHSGPPRSCEVHKTEMHPEWISISKGQIVYMMDYLHVAEQRFPHHGDAVFSGERTGLTQPLDRRLRDFVCPDCTAAFCHCVLLRLSLSLTMRYLKSGSPLAIFLLCFRSFTFPALAHSPAEEMAEAANNFLAALGPEQRAKAVFEFKDTQRFDWHFVPKARKGLPLKEMNSPQRLLAHALLSTGLSQRGYMKATTIMSLEQILYDLEDKAPHRDADLYFVTIFGSPGNTVWGWRVEGHHLSLNFTLEGDQVIAVTPSFFGSNPAKILTGPRKGLRVLGSEEDLARKLVNSLSDDQRKVGLITNIAPRDIITGADRKARALEPLGISAAKLSHEQRELLLSLLKEYVFRYRTEIAESDLKQIRQAGEEKIYFAWAGGLEPGQGHYYRIQGPTFLMEYDNTQDNANHIHTVWRDLLNDFGEDLLRKHYDQVPHPK